MKARVLVPALTALVLVLGACAHPASPGAEGTATSSPGSSSATGGPTSSGAPPAGTAPTTGHSDEESDGDGHAAPFPADTSPDHGQASAGASGNITDIRIGHHDGFDRVVFEFHGTGTPGWTAEYVPQALGQGSGLPIPMAGHAVISVGITGVGYPTETGIQEFPRSRVAVAATDVVTEVYFDGTFEGVSLAYVGTTAKQPFRVYLLTDPARVVLEVASP